MAVMNLKGKEIIRTPTGFTISRTYEQTITIEQLTETRELLEIESESTLREMLTLKQKVTELAERLEETDRLIAQYEQGSELFESTECSDDEVRNGGATAQ